MYSNQPHEADKAQQNANTLYDAIIQALSNLAFTSKERGKNEENVTLSEPADLLQATLEPTEFPQLEAAPDRAAIAPGEEYQLLPGNEPIQIQIGETRIAGTLEGIREQLAELPEAKLMALHEAVSRPALPAAAEEAEEVIDAEIISIEINGEQTFYQNEAGEIELNELNVEPEDIQFDFEKLAYLSEIDEVSELRSSLLEEGFEPNSTGLLTGGAIVEESWSHPEYGMYSFNYENGSNLVVNENDYVDHSSEEEHFEVVSLGQAEQLIQQNPGDSYQEHPELVSQMPTLVAEVNDAGHLQPTPQLRSAVESTVREVEAKEIEVKELEQGDEMMRKGEQLTQQDQTAVATLQQIFERPELQHTNTFEGKRFRVERDGDRLSVLAKDGRGEILSVGEQGVQSRLEPQDFDSFVKAQQILQKAPALATPVRSSQVEMGD